MRLERVNARDVREVLQRIKLSKRPNIANDVLMYTKQLFRHAVKLDLTLNNPAAAFGTNDAGGVEKSWDRALSLGEVKSATAIFRTNMDRFGMDNYLSVCLFLVLGVRKGELAKAPWSEFDLAKGDWKIPDHRVKKGKALLYRCQLRLLNGCTCLKRVFSVESMYSYTKRFNEAIYRF